VCSQFIICHKRRRHHVQDEKASAGRWVWCPDDEQCFVPAQAMQVMGNRTQCMKENGEMVTVATTSLEALKKSSLARLGDLDDLVGGAQKGIKRNGIHAFVAS
jgi:hypothetical protein